IATLDENFISIAGDPRAVAALAARPDVRRVESKKRKEPRLDTIATEIGLRSSSSPRVVEETGRGVLIGIVDSGFDLSHPAFRDTSGNLRVDALYEQKSDTVYDEVQLAHLWST